MVPPACRISQGKPLNYCHLHERAGYIHPESTEPRQNQVKLKSFCVLRVFPICQQKHKIDGKTTAYRTNPLKIKKQTCSRPLLAHVAGLLFCAYTLHGGSVIDFSLSKNIRQSWKELPTPLEPPEHCTLSGRGVSFLPVGLLLFFPRSLF